MGFYSGYRSGVGASSGKGFGPHASQRSSTEALGRELGPVEHRLDVLCGGALRGKPEDEGGFLEVAPRGRLMGGRRLVWE